MGVLAKEETLREVLTQVKILNKQSFDPKSWRGISEIVRSGMARDYLSVGDQIETTVEGETYLLDVVHHFDGSDDAHPLVKLADGSLVPGMCLQWHNALDFTTAFDSKEAFYAATDGLAAGKYSFSIEVASKWGSGAFAAAGTKTYSFELTDAVPAGGQLVFGGDPYASQLTAVGVQVYKSFADTTPAQTCQVSEGAGGTDLGTMKTSVNGNFNQYPRATYGSNHWATSGLREWANSSAPAGGWDKKSTPWDRPHPLAATKGGLLSLLPADMVAVLGAVSVKTQSHPGDSDGGTTVETFDKVFIPSARQHYFANYLVATSDGYEAEGVPWDYWSGLAKASGRTAAWAGWNTYPELITYSRSGNARYVYERSAYRSGSSGNSVGCVTTSGGVGTSNASNGLCVAPACVLI